MTLASPSERMSVTAVLAAMALVVLDGSMVNVALPALGEAFGATPAETIMIASTYQLALVMSLLPCAHLAERLGYRRLFMGGTVLFVLASLLCASAPNLPLLVAARFLQGLGGAAIMALGIALLRLALGIERLGAAIAWNAFTVALSSAAGPAIGSLILHFAEWPWLFLGSIPVGIAALLAARGLPESARGQQPVDGVGVAMHAAAVALLFTALRLAEPRSWTTAAFLAPIGLIALTALVRRERSSPTPIVPIDLLSSKPFRVSVLTSICCFAAQSSGLVALPFFLQNGLGYGPLVTGLVITLWPGSVAVTSVAARRLADRVSPAAQCAVGGALLATGLLLSACAPASQALVVLSAGTVLCGAGFGLIQLANNRSMFLTAPAERSAAAGGMQATARLTGQTSGTIITALVFGALLAANAPRVALTVGALFALAAAAVSALGARQDPRRASRPADR